MRGLLCTRHNVGLGMFADDPRALRAAATYIEHLKRGSSNEEPAVPAEPTGPQEKGRHR